MNDLTEIARAAVDRIRLLADLRGIQLHTRLDRAAAIFDGNRMAQVVTNLVRNAIEYDRTAGEVRISIDMDNDAVVLTVSDTGIGMGS